MTSTHWQSPTGSVIGSLTIVIPPFPISRFSFSATARVLIFTVLLLPLSALPAFSLNTCDLPEDFALTRPLPPNGGPTIVHVSFYLFDLIEIVTMKQEFSVDLYFTAHWHDPRVKAALRQAGIRKCEIRSEKVWRPDMIIMNERKKRMDLPRVLRLSDDGTVEGAQRIIGTYASPLDLTHFPLDEQRLSISFLSLRYTPEQMKVVFDSADTDQEFTETAWELESLTGVSSLFDLGVMTIKTNELDKLSRFDITIQVQRETAYYIWKVFIPLCLIVMVSWAVFWIDPAQMGIQTGIGTGMMLSIIAFLFSLQRILPKVPYLTRIDYFVYSSLFFIVLAFLETLVSCGMHSRGHEAAARRLDVISRIVFPVAFITVIIWFWQIW